MSFISYHRKKKSTKKQYVNVRISNKKGRAIYKVHNLRFISSNDIVGKKMQITWFRIIS